MRTEGLQRSQSSWRNTMGESLTRQGRSHTCPGSILSVKVDDLLLMLFTWIRDSRGACLMDTFKSFAHQIRSLKLRHNEGFEKFLDLQKMEICVQELKVLTSFFSTFLLTKPFRPSNFRQVSSTRPLLISITSVPGAPTSQMSCLRKTNIRCM